MDYFEKYHDNIPIAFNILGGKTVTPGEFPHMVCMNSNLTVCRILHNIEIFALHFLQDISFEFNDFIVILFTSIYL